MAGISASIASIKIAIATSWFVIVAVAAVAVAIVGIIYTVDRAIALSVYANKVIARVKAKVKANSLNKKDLRDNTVYVIHRKNNTDVHYVGITKNFNARQNAHKREKLFDGFDTYEMTPIATGLTRTQARIIEQTIITAYTLDTLKNMINSISPKKWKAFKREYKQMQHLMIAWTDPE